MVIYHSIWNCSEFFEGPMIYMPFPMLMNFPLILLGKIKSQKYRYYHNPQGAYSSYGFIFLDN